MLLQNYPKGVAKPRRKSNIESSRWISISCPIAIVDKKAKGYMCIIKWGEIYYNTYRVLGENHAEKVLLQLTRYAFEFIDADQSLNYEAAKLKGRHDITYADCFAAALAIRLDAKVVTGDPEFRKLESEIAVEWVV